MTISWTTTKPALTYCLILLIFFLPIFFIKKEIPQPSPAPPEEEIPAPVEVPDFAGILDVQLKKQTFFNFLEPYIEEVNEEVLLQRNRLVLIRDKILNRDRLSSSDQRFISTLAEQYELEADDYTSPDFINLLLRRVDTIPTSLALAQAANESAWGTSRFAQDGLNFFGQWCYSDGCGIVPSRRREGAIHEVKRFDTVTDSVRAYIHNLNTFPSYQMLRRIRQQLRQQNRPIDGLSLADGLESYSERGLDYIEEVQNMIYANNLLARDDPTR